MLELPVKYLTCVSLMTILPTILLICKFLFLVKCDKQIDIHDYEKYFYESALIDPLMEDDHEDPDLTDIIRQAKAPDKCYGAGCPDLDIDEFSDEQRKQIADLHNIYRSNMTNHIPQGANMKYMEYNRTLEWAAVLWLQECKYEHGHHEKDNMSTVTGQNLYTGPSRIVSRSIYLWYMENPDYVFENDSCTKEPMSSRCGHFITLLWGDTQVVGCAIRSNCYPRSRWRVIVSCHYHPRGFRHKDFHLSIYSFGLPCTRCVLEDGNLCHKNLCVDKRMIQTYNLEHTCELDCLNCGVPNKEECRCDCKSGWDRTDCSEPCANRGYWPFNPNWAGSCAYVTTVQKTLKCDTNDLTQFQCRKYCDFCKGIEKDKNYTKNDLCCGGKVCALHSVLDPNTCKCRLNCPTQGCLYNATWRVKAEISRSVAIESDMTLLIRLLTCIVIVL